MDENLSTAVKEAFVRLHAEGLIYRWARGGGALRRDAPAARC